MSKPGYEFNIVQKINRETLEGEIAFRFQNPEGEIIVVPLTPDDARNTGINLILAADRSAQEAKLAEFLKVNFPSFDNNAIARFIYDYRVYAKRQRKEQSRIIIPGPSVEQ